MTSQFGKHRIGRQGLSAAVVLLMVSLLGTACAASTPAAPTPAAQSATAAPATAATTLATSAAAPASAVPATVAATTVVATATQPPAATLAPTTAPKPAATLPAPTLTAAPVDVPGVGRVVATIPLVGQVGSVRVGAGSIWLSVEGGPLLRLDPATHAVIASVPVVALDVVVAGDSVWAAEDGNGRVAKIDAKTNRVVEEISTGAGKNLGPIAVDGDNLWLAVADQSRRVQTVIKLDTLSKKVVAQNNEHGDLWGLAVAGGSVWASDEAGDQVLRLDPKTARTLAKIPVGIAPADIAFADGSIWTANRDGSVSRIDPATNKEVANILVGGALYSLSIGEGALWVAGRGDSCQEDGQVARINPQTNSVVGVMHLPCALSVAVAQGAVWAADNVHQARRAGLLWQIAPAAAAGS